MRQVFLLWLLFHRSGNECIKLAHGHRRRRWSWSQRSSPKSKPLAMKVLSPLERLKNPCPRCTLCGSGYVCAMCLHPPDLSWLIWGEPLKHRFLHTIYFGWSGSKTWAEPVWLLPGECQEEAEPGHENADELDLRLEIHHGHQLWVNRESWSAKKEHREMLRCHEREFCLRGASHNADSHEAWLLLAFYFGILMRVYFILN